MTWGWFLGKNASTFLLNGVSCNPVGWVVGGAASELLVESSWRDMNDYNSDFDKKIRAWFVFDWSCNYRSGLLFGAVGKGIGKGIGSLVTKEVSKETARIGQQAAKEIAKNGGKFTPLARQLIDQGRRMAFNEKAIVMLCKGSKWLNLRDLIKWAFDRDISEIIEIFNKSKDNFEDEEINVLLDSLEEKIKLIIENKEEESQEDFKESIKDKQKKIFKINQENISCYLKENKNYCKHERVDAKISKIMEIIKPHSEFKNVNEIFEILKKL